MRILRIVGAEGSDNNRYVGYATLAAAVREIDGVPVAFPFSLVALEATVTRLDEEGLAAVGKALMALTPALDTAGRPGFVSGPLRTVAWLVRNGLSYQEAIEMDETEAWALSIIFGEFEGGEFDFDHWTWRERRA